MKSAKNYVYTEHAHFMCPNMHFGIMAKIESNYEEGKLRQSIDTLQKAHPLLQSFACYIHMLPELIDAVAISTLGDFEVKQEHL